MLKAELQNISEEELIRGCSDGKELHCRILFEKYYGKMLNVCRRYASDRDESRDMVQEGFIRVFKNIGQYKGEGSFEGWMRRVMVTTCINYFHKHHRHNEVDYGDDTELLFSGNGSEHYAETKIPYAEKQSEAVLLALVQKLPQAFRVVFNLHVIEGYSHSEIAVKLNISESTSRTNLLRARKKLMNIIQSNEFQKI